MADSAIQASEPSPDIGPIVYEQPLTERMRTFLRIEFLQAQALFHARDPSDFGARAAIASLLEILSVVGRADVRADVLKELDRHAEQLQLFRRTPGVDSERLNRLIEDVDTLRKKLGGLGMKFSNPLKENEFLNMIRQRSAIPGGTCVFDLPDYGYWLHLPHDERSAHLRTWLDQLRPVGDAVAQVLWLTREATEPVQCEAPNGLYQRTLDKQGQYNLVRILLPAGSGMFPEISAGPHRFTVRFVEWLGVSTRPRQVSDTIQFRLALC